MKNYILLFALCFAIVSCQQGSTDTSAGANDNQNNNRNESAQASMNNENPDKDFAMKAAEGGLLEVKLGELAQSKASSAEVKNFGQQMTSDHSKANEELKSLAQKKNIMLPTALGEEKQKKYDDLAAKSGTEFDKAYTDFMVKDHKEDVELFEKQAENGKDADLKNWASGKVPVLKHHLSMAEKMQSAL